MSFAKNFWPCSWNATYDSLLASNKPFAKPIPLPVSPPIHGGVFFLCFFGIYKQTKAASGNMAWWTFFCLKLAGNDRFSCGYLGAGWMGCMMTETGVTLVSWTELMDVLLVWFLGNLN